MKEVFNGQAIWDGIVEVFELHRHALADTVYALSHPTEDHARPKCQVTVRA